ncbi:DNRLRE domain-containing protein [Clostridium sp. UBA2485]|uniref:DNRLRE domain-containing protein n=1 Tax=Clostridium sp. UBA2485 TaxID=1946352 RepID=UPI0025BA34B2|nr:DNRLRE domain-containing protein [Clostridium sp. UBA2485]
MATKRYTIKADTYIDGDRVGGGYGSSNTNYNGRNYLESGERQESNGDKSYRSILLDVDFSDLRFKNIEYIELNMYSQSLTDNDYSEFRVFGISSSWNVNTVTSKNIPSLNLENTENRNRLARVENGLANRWKKTRIWNEMAIDMQINSELKYGMFLEGSNGSFDQSRFDIWGSSESGYIPYIDVFYEDAIPLKPTLYNPINIYVNNQENVIFEWKYNTGIKDRKLGLLDKQHGVEIRIKHELGNWYTAYSSSTYSQQEISLTSTQHKLETGKNEWQIRTSNIYGEWSPWSEAVSFNALGLPKAPVVTVVQEGARPIVTWTATYQQVYQVQILNSKGEVIHDSGSIASLSNKTYKVPIFMENGNYTARVRIKNEFDLFSNWGTKVFTISTTPKEPFNIIIQSAGDFTHIRFNANGDYFLIYRRLYEEKEFKIVGQTKENNYKDYAIKGNARYVYFVRAVLSEEFTDSKRALIETYLKYPILASVNDLSKVLQIKSNFDEPLKRNYNLINEGDYLYFEGRQHPVKKINNFKRNSYSLTFFIREQQLKLVEDLYNSNSVLLYRDNYKKIYCTVENGIDIRSTNIGGYSVQMNLIETDYKEEFNG